MGPGVRNIEREEKLFPPVSPAFHDPCSAKRTFSSRREARGHALLSEKGFGFLILWRLVVVNSLAMKHPDVSLSPSDREYLTCAEKRCRLPFHDSETTGPHSMPPILRSIPRARTVKQHDFSRGSLGRAPHQGRLPLWEALVGRCTS